MSARGELRAATAWKALFAVLLIWGAGAPTAQAAFGVQAFDGGAFEQSGQASTRAGAHPYRASATIEFFETTNSAGERVVDGSAVRDVYVDLPAGLIGNPEATPRCKAQDFYQPGFLYPDCAANTQVGVTTVDTNGAGGPDAYPVYSLVPPPGKPAAFGFKVAVTPVVLTASLRSDGDYGITVEAERIPQALPIFGTSVTLWGVPADPSHDAMRGPCLEPGWGPTGNLCPSQASRTPFLTNPTACTPGGAGLVTGLRTDSWLDPGSFVRSSFVSPGPTECDTVRFDPTLEVRTTSTEADSPTGLDVEISVPTDGLLNPTGTAQSALKKAVVTLPAGMSVNPSSANGLGACSESQLAGETAASGPGAGCPESAKVGSVEIETPLLEDPLEGSVYLASQGQNPFGSLLALYVVAKDPERGVILKLDGRVDPDPATGRLVTTFDDNPQLPFSKFRFRLNGGPNAPLVNPPSCGSFGIGAELSPWARPGEPVSTAASFEVRSGPGATPCSGLGGFDPSLRAGTLSPLGGAFSPLVLNVSRPDGSAGFTALRFDLPSGLTGRLAGIPYCPEAALANAAARAGLAERGSPSCPAAAQVGSVDVAAGVGQVPYVVPGKVYLAGPYKGAPISFAVVTPAVAGPLDLGTVVVRAAAHVDPATARISVSSDPIPTILEGIPLKVRSIAIDNDRDRFTLNPTSCDPMAIAAMITSTAGSVATPTARFQVAACERLAFRPKLSLRLKGATKRSGHPQLTAVLTQRPGGANIARASVAMPRSEFLSQDHIRTVCTRVQFAADACPKGSVYGRARAFSPLLDRPLEGPVYLRSSSNPLPDLVADLRGQIDVELVGRIDSRNGGIRTTFETVPDAPVSRFVLRMHGGKRSLLENSENLCRSKNRATVEFDAHSGKVRDFRPLMRAGCGRGGQR
ncbi:MAG TPA: hypothetical protein VF030_10350 [Solirubrobacterales bacterium]